MIHPSAIIDASARIGANVSIGAFSIIGADVEIGGSDQLSYGDLMREYARQRGLRRWIKSRVRHLLGFQRVAHIETPVNAERAPGRLLWLHEHLERVA